MDILSCKKAKTLGFKSYFTGRPCINGHISKRSVINRTCVECSANKLQKYRFDNRESLLYRKQVAAKIYHKKNPEKVKATAIKSTAKNRIVRNIEKAAWARKNKPKVMALTRKRQASKLLRTPKWLGSEECWLIEQAYELAPLRTKMFGFAWHVDHVIPLQGKNVSGLHVPQNLQVIPGIDNIRKRNNYVVV
jgi:hypothetical protein